MGIDSLSRDTLASFESILKQVSDLNVMNTVTAQFESGEITPVG